MASIYEKQSNPLIIQSLFAQRRYYTYAKIWTSVYFVICIALVCFFAVLKSFCKCDFITGLSIGLSIATFFASLSINEVVSKLKKKAAEIQQYIDASVFKREEDGSAIWQSPLTTNKIKEIVSSFPKSGFCKNDKWYEDYSSQPYKKQIVLCQKENIRWDKNLRAYYKYSCIVLLIVAIIAIFIIGLSRNSSFLEILSFISWSLPFIKYCYSFKKRMNEDGERLEKLNRTADSLAELDFENHSEAFHLIVGLQNDIFEHRKKAVLIPNFFFKFFYKFFQSKEEKIAGNYRGE